MSGLVFWVSGIVFWMSGLVLNVDYMHLYVFMYISDVFMSLVRPTSVPQALFPANKKTFPDDYVNSENCQNCKNCQNFNL